MNEGGGSADASFNFRAVIRGPDQQDTRGIIERIFLSEDGESADASLDDRTIVHEPERLETREVLDTIISPEISLKKETIGKLIDQYQTYIATSTSAKVPIPAPVTVPVPPVLHLPVPVLPSTSTTSTVDQYCTASSTYVACTDVLRDDRVGIDGITPPVVHAEDAGLLQPKPQTVDIPSPRFDALKSEVKAASFAGELPPSPCGPAEGELTGDRSSRKDVGDRGGICRTPCSGGGDRSSDCPHVRESPAPRSIFNRVGIG